MQQQDYFEQVIITIANAMTVGADLDQIHDSLIDKGWSEDDIFLFIKAAQILVKDMV